MSTVAATNLKNASSAVNNAVTTSGGDLTNAAGVSFMGGSKNLLYNGAMQVAQRGTSTASITTTGFNTADRWRTELSSLGAYTQSVEADGPTGSGITKSLKMLVTTANAAPSSNTFSRIVQSLEGQDVQRIAKGTASAQQLTLSFWVKSNVTGTYVAALRDLDNSRYIAATYTISASATWERKTIAFAADTTGAFDNDNAGSLDVYFWLGAGSTYTSGTLASGAWQAVTAANFAVGQTNLAAATNNYWQVTGVQLEVGPVATSFEFKSYGQELRECQRYYSRCNTGSGVAIGTTSVSIALVHPEMRVTPTAVTATAAMQITDVYAADFNQSSANVTAADTGTAGGRYSFGNFTGLTQGRAYVLEGGTGAVYVSAEL